MKINRFGVLGLGLAVSLFAASAAPVMAADDIKRGGAITAVIGSMVPSLDPLFGSSPGADRRVFNLFYESLLLQSQDGAFHPALATEWEWSEDGKSITFKLREGVTFHDGTPFNAEAAKFNLDRATDESLNSRAQEYTAILDSTEVIDDYTIRLNLKSPSAAFLSILALEPASMVSPAAVEKYGEDFPRNPVGTGPFKFESWVGDAVTASRNDDYWKVGADGENLPYLDEVTIRAISNSAVSLTELKAGTVHMSDGIQVKDYASIEADPNLELTPAFRNLVQYLAFNNKAEPFKDNPELRKAISLAIDREKIEKAITRGQGTSPKGLMPPNSWAYSDDIVGHDYDLEAAKEAYAKSGHTGEVTLSVIQRDPDTQVAQIVQAMLKDAGINLRIEVLERAAWLDKVLTYNHEIGLLRAGLPRADPDLSFSTYWGRDAKQDFAGIFSPTMWDLIDAARVATDQEERKRLYVEAQQYVLDNYFQTYLYWTPSRQVVNSKLQNVQLEAGSGPLYGEIWLDQ